MSDQLTDAPQIEEEAVVEDVADDQVETEGQEAEEDEGPTLEYKGAKYRVDPAVKEAYETMQSETTRKFQEAAEIKKAAEAAREEQSKMDGMRAQFYREIASVETMNEQLKEYEKVDWLRWKQENPEAARDAEMEQIRIERQRDRLLGSIRAKIDENTVKQSQALQARRVEFESQVKTRVKDWSPQREQALEKTATDYGFSTQEFKGMALVDARVAHVLHDAHLWRTSQKKVSAPQLKNVTTIPKVTGGGAPSNKDPDKMTNSEWNAWMDKQEAQKRRQATKH